jgi:two-component system, sensor histidine kinase and response regulator
MTEKIKILYVDDEQNNLIAFFSYFRKEYEVYTALSAAIANDLLRKTEMNIIVSDQRMPGTTGVEFLEQTIHAQPNAVRILITGQSDLEVVVEAINRGQIAKYVQKPWDWEKLSLTIENCVLKYKSQTELQHKNKELQNANEKLNRLLFILSHDLRAPLMSILGIVHLAKTNKDALTEENYLNLIEKCILKLDGFVKNIITYYKNSSVDHANEQIDFTKLVNDVFTALSNQDRNVTFQSDIQQKDVFFGDPFRMSIIFNNIVSNAIKYQNPDANHNSVNVKILADKNCANVSISDNGIGISHEHIDNIFNLFFRVNNSKEKDGTGIGLYIVKEALEKIGGTINVVSTPNMGTSFNMIIPNKIVLE